MKGMHTVTVIKYTGAPLRAHKARPNNIKLFPPKVYVNDVELKNINCPVRVGCFGKLILGPEGEKTT